MSSKRLEAGLEWLIVVESNLTLKLVVPLSCGKHTLAPKSFQSDATLIGIYPLQLMFFEV